MSEQRNKIILAIILASILVILLGGVSLAFFPTQVTRSPSTPNAAPIPAVGGSTGMPAILIIPVDSTVELNSSTGFNSSILATGILTGTSNSTMFVLPPGETGSVPFSTYLVGANETVNVSLSVYLGSSGAESYGVQFNVSPANFTLSPGQQVTSVLTVTADQNAPAAFYMPTVEIQTNSTYIVGGSVNIPALLVSNSTPACLFLENEQEIIPPIAVAPLTPDAAGVSGTNASVSSPPPTTVTPIIINATSGSPTQASPIPIPTGIPGLNVPPTINIAPGETTTVLYGCLTQDNLNLNFTAPTGFTANFSPNPLNIIFSYTSGKIYALTITADSTISSGTYEINATGALGSYQFDASFYITIK
jgi:hypothetical protein